MNDYYAKYLSSELTRKCPSDSMDKLAATLSEAQVDLRNSHGMSLTVGDKPVDYRMTVMDRIRIRSMVFAGFQKCLFQYQKFDSDPERRFAVMLESSNEVLKWFRPNDHDIRIYLRGESQYRPDFIVEAKTAKYGCEVKADDEMNSADVLEKARAAVLWCEHGTEYESTINGKSWAYLLVPESGIDAAVTFPHLVSRFIIKTQ